MEREGERERECHYDINPRTSPPKNMAVGIDRGSRVQNSRGTAIEHHPKKPHTFARARPNSLKPFTY